MKKLFILSILIIFLLSLSTNPVFAGSKQHYRWEGVAIGLGAAILGSAILNNCQPEHTTVVEHETYYHPAPPRHCELQQIWVPPVTERIWNPGHYEYGGWVPGHYILIERAPGHWIDKRVCYDY